MLFHQQQLAAILILVGSIYASRVKATAMLTHRQSEWKGRQVTSHAWQHFYRSSMTVNACKNIMGYIPDNDFMHTQNVYKFMPAHSKIISVISASIKLQQMCNFCRQHD
jgi:hypothetical protein